MFCMECGNKNDDSARFCSTCGKTLSTTDTGKNSHDISEFYRAVIGQKNQDYYFRQFSRFDSDGKIGASWHWPAFFVTFYWFLYRKMWLNALIYFILPYVLMIPIGIVAAAGGEKAADTIISLGYLLYILGIFLLPPIYANALYYKHCNKKISEATASPYDKQRQLGELYAKGGTSNIILIIIIIFVLFIPVVGILAAIAIPANQDYTIRARMSESFVVGKNATDFVSNYYYQNQHIPTNLREAGFDGRLPPTVKEITIDNKNGTIIITMAAPAPIEDKSLLLVPSLDEKKQIVWKCMSEDIPDKYLPRQCRQ